ncbi:hypothetical protein B0J17DRAFT_641098 [Rhizoctonia solani]|nr:hypothetical protein B0J17DRAFT_641098 [Rhizoctonia solani]
MGVLFVCFYMSLFLSLFLFFFYFISRSFLSLFFYLFFFIAFFLSLSFIFIISSVALSFFSSLSAGGRDLAEVSSLRVINLAEGASILQ